MTLLHQLKKEITSNKRRETDEKAAYGCSSVPPSPHHKGRRVWQPVSWLTLLFHQRLHGDGGSQAFMCSHLHLFPQVGMLLSTISLALSFSRRLAFITPLLCCTSLAHPSPLSQLLQLKRSPCRQEAGGFSDQSCNMLFELIRNKNGIEIQCCL